MSPTATSISIFAAALDATLHNYPRRGDLAREIMARAHWLRDPRDLRALAWMGTLSGGQCFGPEHLDRLRIEFQTT